MTPTEQECGNPVVALNYNNIDQSYELTMDWAKSFAITNREFIFLVTYAVISGLWVASSTLIICKCQYM